MVATALGGARLYLELRDVTSMRGFARALMQPSERPKATRHDRNCPLCRKGFVTRRNTDTVWPDAAVRLLGFVRTYLELRGSERGVGLRELAIVVVDGDDVALRQAAESAVQPPPQPQSSPAPEPEPDPGDDAELVDATPFDRTADVDDDDLETDYEEAR
jgi:hypothetical protein